MAATGRHESAMMMHAAKQASFMNTPIEKIRNQCLQRGANGIKGFGRCFRIMDDNSDRKLSQEEFRNGLLDFGIKLGQEEIASAFETLDKDKSGSINFEEFLREIRPPMSDFRLNLINKAFRKMDQSGDGLITVTDLKGIYNFKKNPKYLNGELTEEQVFKEFLKSFEAPNEEDGKITTEEFINYYSGVSASIDSDTYFDLMMRNAWKL